MIIDTSALVAFLKNEIGAGVVERHFGGACISGVTLAETAGRMERDGIPSADTVRAFTSTPIEIVQFDAEQAIQAGVLIQRVRGRNLSFADCCCLALAIVRKLPVLAADRPWRGVELPIEVRLIR